MFIGVRRFRAQLPFVQHSEVDPEVKDVERDGECDETDRPGHEVLDGVHKGPRHVSHDVPQLEYSKAFEQLQILHSGSIGSISPHLFDGVQPHKEDDEEPDEFDGKGAGDHEPGCSQPEPPREREGGLLEGAEPEEGERRAGDEKEERRVEEDVAVERQHADIFTKVLVSRLKEP